MVLEIATASDKIHVFIIDAAATKPTDSIEKNPILAFQRDRFSWEQVVGICLSHAHADHFTGLAALAQKTTNAKWMQPTLTALDAFVDYYDTVANVIGFSISKQPASRWIANSIREIAEWGKSADTFHCLTNRCFENSHGYIMTIIAPEDNIAENYNRQLHENIQRQFMEIPDYSPRNLHNVASSGIVLDLITGDRVLLLGDMVEESWGPLLESSDIVSLLEQRKATIIKLPHHCSSGAVFSKLLELTCDPEVTVAAFTPYSYSRDIPDMDTVSKVTEHVKELWSTVGPDRENISWTCNSYDNILLNRLVNTYIQNPKNQTINPVDCRVTISIQKAGDVTVFPGEFAICYKERSC